MVPCGLVIHYEGQPETRLHSDDELTLTDVTTQQDLTSWQLLSKIWFEQPNIEPGLWTKRFHFHANGSNPSGTIDFEVIVERRRYVSHAGWDFLGLVDQQSKLAHVSNLETPPIDLANIERNWKRLPEGALVPEGVFGLGIKTIMPPKKEGDKIQPNFPAATLRIGLAMKPETPMPMHVESFRRGTSGGSQNQ